MTAEYFKLAAGVGPPAVMEVCEGVSISKMVVSIVR